MHLFRIIAFHIIRNPSIATEKLIKFVMADTCENGRVSNFITIQMKDRQHSPVGNRIKKFIGVPCSCQRSGFRFTVTDNACNDQSGVIEYSSKSMAERITQLTSLVAVSYTH